MERMMLGIKLANKKRNTWIRERTKVEDIAIKVAKLKWCFAGHTIRKKDNRWDTAIQQWKPYLGQRTRGRPQMKWGDDFKRIAGLHWRRLAQNRDRCGESWERPMCSKVDDKRLKKKNKKELIHRYNT